MANPTTEIPDNFTDTVSAFVSAAVSGLVTTPDSSTFADLTETTAATATAPAPVSEDTTSGQSSGLRQYEMTVFWLWAVGIPIVLVMGTFGNVMSILVVRHLKKELYALRITMTSLAISDTVCLWISGIVTFCPKVIKFDILGSHDVTCKVGLWLTFIAAILSTWFLAMLTVQRAIGVWWPMKLRVMCTRKASLVVVVSLVLVIAACYSHMLNGAEVQSSYPHGTFTACFFPLISHYMHFWGEIWSKLDLCISAVFPAILIVGCNTSLSIALVQNKLRMRRARVHPTTNQGVARDQNTVFSIVIVMSVSVAFLCLTIPFSACFALYGGGKTPEQVIVFEATFFLLYCNYGINFYLYILTGKTYRQILRAIFI